MPHTCEDNSRHTYDTHAEAPEITQGPCRGVMTHMTTRHVTHVDTSHVTHVEKSHATQAEALERTPGLCR